MATERNTMNRIGTIIAVVVLVAVGAWVGLGQGSAGATASPQPKTSPDTPEHPLKTVDVTINGKKFHLEPALDEQTRFHGLSGRETIAEDGGMLFVFKEAHDHLDFVMRDCPIPIDIIYLDSAGRAVAWHKMVPEPPRGEDEKALTLPFKGAPEWAGVNDKYEARLKKYPSKFSAQFVIELKGNTIDKLDLKPGQKVELDIPGLKKLAK